MMSATSDELPDELPDETLLKKLCLLLCMPQNAPKCTSEHLNLQSGHVIYIRY